MQEVVQRRRDNCKRANIRNGPPEIRNIPFDIVLVLISKLSPIYTTEFKRESELNEIPPIKEAEEIFSQ